MLAQKKDVSLLAKLIRLESSDCYWEPHHVARHLLEQLHDSGTVKPFVMQLVTGGVTFDAEFVNNEEIAPNVVSYDSKRCVIRIARSLQTNIGQVRNSVYFKSKLVAELWRVHCHQIGKTTVTKDDLTIIEEFTGKDIVLRREVLQGSLKSEDALAQWKLFIAKDHGRSAASISSWSKRMGWGKFENILRAKSIKKK